jgi:hypothetical protein
MKDLERLIDELYNYVETETDAVNVDDWVLYDLINDGWSYDELLEYFSASDIERVTGMVMRNEEPI